MPAVPWDDIRANRVLVVHIYHRIDYETLWETPARDVPSHASEIEAWRSAQVTPAFPQEPEHRAYRAGRCSGTQLDKIHNTGQRTDRTGSRLTCMAASRGCPSSGAARESR